MPQDILYFNDGNGNVRQVPANKVDTFKKHFPKAWQAEESQLSSIESQKATKSEQEGKTKITAPQVNTVDMSAMGGGVSLTEGKPLSERASDIYNIHKADPEISFRAKYGAYKEDPSLFRDTENDPSSTPLTSIASEFHKKNKKPGEMESIQDFLTNTDQGRAFVDLDSKRNKYFADLDIQLNKEIENLESSIREKATARQKLIERPVPGTRYGVNPQWLSADERARIDAAKALDVEEADKIATQDDLNLAAKNLEELKMLRGAVKDRDTNAVAQFFNEAGRRLPKSLYNIGTMGFGDVIEGLSPTKGGKLSAQSENLLNQYAALHQDDRSIAQDIAQGAVGSLEFMAQFAGAGGVVGGIGKNILKQGVKQAATKGPGRMLRIAGKEVSETLMQTAIMPSTIAMAIENNAQNPGSFLDSFANAYLSNLVEVGSERVGQFIPGPKFKLPSSVQKLQKATGIDGMVGEFLEEQIATAGHSALGDGQAQWSDLIDPRQQLITAGVVGIIQLPYASINAAGYAAGKFRNVNQKRSINKAFTQNMEAMNAVFGTDTEPTIMWLNNAIDQAQQSGEGVASLMASLVNKGEFAEEQTNAMLNYGLSYLAKKGLETAKEEQIQNAQAEAQQLAEQAVNPETNSIILATVPGMEEPTRIQGNVILREDGSVDASKSGEIYYTDAEGKRKVIDPRFIEIVENVPAEQAIEELSAMKAAEVVNQHANDEVRPYEAGELVRFTADGNLSMLGQIQGADEAGNYQVIVDGVPAPVIVEPRMIINEDNLQGVDNGVVVDYTDESGNVLTGTVDDMSIRGHGVIVIDGKEIRTENVIGVHSEEETQAPSTIITSENAPENEGTTIGQTPQSVTETAETEAESQNAAEVQAVQEFPKDKDGNIDYSKITDNNAYVEALRSEFGDEAYNVVDDYRKAAEKALKSVDKIDDPIRKRREQARRQAELDRWNSMIEATRPKAKAPTYEEEYNPILTKNTRERESQMGDYLSLRDYLLRNIGTGKLRFMWNSRDGRTGLKDEILSSKNTQMERLRRIAFLDNNGFTPETLAEFISDNNGQDIPEFSTLDVQDIRNEINDVLLSFDTPTDMIEAAEKLRRDDVSLESYIEQNISPDEIANYEANQTSQDELLLTLPEHEAPDISEQELNEYYGTTRRIEDIEQYPDTERGVYGGTEQGDQIPLQAASSGIEKTEERATGEQGTRDSLAEPDQERAEHAIAGYDNQEDRAAGAERKYSAGQIISINGADHVISEAGTYVGTNDHFYTIEKDGQTVYEDITQDELDKLVSNVSEPVGIDNQIENVISGEISPEEQRQVNEKAKYAQEHVNEIVKINGANVYDVEITKSSTGEYHFNYNLRKTGKTGNQKYYYPVQYAKIEYKQQEQEKQQPVAEQMDDEAWNDLLYGKVEPVDLDKIEEEDLEQWYQESDFSKTWAKTRKEAIEISKKEYADALAIYNDWASKVYKKSNQKIEVIDNTPDAADDIKKLSVDRINENRRRKTLDAQQEVMSEALERLKKLRLPQDEIDKLVSEKTTTEQPSGPSYNGDIVDYARNVVKNEEVKQEAAKVDTNPTDAQKEAGNYKKGHVNVQGFDITIENPKGSVRSGVDASGKKWSVEMKNHYGYFKRTEGYDGDQIDTFIGPNPENSAIFVVDQVNNNKSFDESKVMLGFNSIDEAREAYLSNYEAGWQGLGAITETTVDDFKKWLYDGAKQRKAFSEYKENKPEYGANNKIITTDRYNELREQMRKKLNNLNVGFDPEVFSIGAQMAMYHIESGANKFAEFAKRMVDDLGDAIRPYLKASYEGARAMPGMEDLSKTMDPYNDVVAFDVNKNFNVQSEYKERKEQISREIDDLIKIRDQKYPNPDIESPMSPEEKELNSRISKLQSDRNQLVLNNRKQNGQKERSTETIEAETETVETASGTIRSESENVGSDKQRAGQVKEKADDQIRKVEGLLNEIDQKLASLKLSDKEYSTEGIAADYPINVLAKGQIRKDVTAYVKAVAAMTGLDHDTNSKGKTEVVNINIAPAGGNASFILWGKDNPEYGVYVSIPYDPDINSGGYYDNYKVRDNHILWRVTTKQNKWRGLSNQWLNVDATAQEMAETILKGLNQHLRSIGLQEEVKPEINNVPDAEKNKKVKKKTSKSDIPSLFDIFDENNYDNVSDIQNNSLTLDEGNEEVKPVNSNQNDEPRRRNEETDSSLGTGTRQEVGRTEQGGMDRSGIADNGPDRSGSGRIPGSPDHAEKLQLRNTNNNRNERGKDYSPKSPKARFNANITAIKLMRKLNDSGITVPTKEQMETLRMYSGWGGLGTFFDNDTTENKTLRTLLSDEEYQNASDSVRSAYYTPADVIDSLWDIAERLGFKGGNVLESSAGIGSIIGSMPQNISDRSTIEGVEIDSVSGEILKLLYPDAKIHVQGFENTNIRNGSVDLAITNVPFVTGLNVYDPVDKDLSRKFKNIHDFVIAKNIRKLKEGGIGIFITTKGTLDSSKKLREWIVSNGSADVIGAFRLNNETFEGTGVTSDIIVVRKRVAGKVHDGAINVIETTIERSSEYETDDAKWVRNKGYVREVKEVDLIYNKYFADNPQFMGGEMAFGFEHGDTYRPTSISLYPKKGINQNERLSEWVKQFDPLKDEVPVDDKQKVRELEETSIKEGQLFIDSKGNIAISSRGLAEDPGINSNKVKGRPKTEVLKDYNSIKESVDALLKYQIDSPDDSGLKPHLDKLNKAYDDFVSKYGQLNNNTSISWLRKDVDFPAIAALEKYKEHKSIDGKKTIKVNKTLVFKQRVIGYKSKPVPKNIKDAVVASVYEYNDINIPYISEALSISEDNVREEILSEGLGFSNPQTGAIEIRHRYLSGNVREKLRIAKDSNVNGEYDANIMELEKVVPMDIPAHLIDMTIGSTWVPPSIFEQYFMDRYGVRLKLHQTEGAWVITPGSKGGQYNDKNRQLGVYSEMFQETIFGDELAYAAMNNRNVVFKKIRKNYDGSQETITDKEASATATRRISEIKADFTDWSQELLTSNEEIAEKIMKTYNDKFNAIVPMSIDEKFIPEKFDGAATFINLYPHQLKSAVRATMQPLFLAHEVGTGKTFTIISAAMEMRRVGTAKKPMIVVQNATIGQFVAEAKTLYPNAKILALSDSDRDKKGRLAFYANIKYNDWDMVIIPQSTFDMIPDSPERQRTFIEEKIDEKIRVIEAMRDIDTDGRIVKQMEDQLEDLYDELAGRASKKKKKSADRSVAVDNAGARAKEQLDRRTDDVQYFDDLGVDALLVDEAHAYKKLGYETTMARGVKGIDTSRSKRAAGLYIKSRAILEKSGWKNFVLATGTPITNTAAELWTFMRFLLPKDTLIENDMYYFDDFAKNFGSIDQMLEFATSGKYKENTRFAKYINLAELVRIWASVSDTVLTKEAGYINDKVPVMETGQAQDVYLEQSDTLVDVMRAVRKKLEEFDKMSGKEKKQFSYIPIVMYGIAKRAAIDTRLIDKNSPDEPLSKTNKTVDEVLKSLEDTKSYNGAVAVFCDNQNRTDNGVVTFNIFEDIKQKLIDKGVPENQIIIMKSGMNIKQKQKIFADVNEGVARVIMGSTETLGTGVNIQERLHTLIHMDAPDLPMQYTQRMGRILRQGNLHKEWNKPVRVLRFGVVDSLDVTAYQRLQTKSNIIDSVMDGKSIMANAMENRSIEESSESGFGNTVAQLSGSQYALLKNHAEKELQKLLSKRKQHEYDQIYISNQVRRNEGIIRANESIIKDAKDRLSKIKSFFPEGKPKSLSIAGNKIEGKISIEEALKEYVNKPVNEFVENARKNTSYKTSILPFEVKADNVVFTVNVKITRDSAYDEKVKGLRISMRRNISYSSEQLNMEEIPVSGAYAREAINDILENVIPGKDDSERIEYVERASDRLRAENVSMNARKGKKFELEDDLREAEKKVEEYAVLMQKELEEKEKKYNERGSGKDVDIESIELEDEEIESDETDTGYREDKVKLRLDDESGFYSTVEDALDKIAQEKGTPDQFKSMLLKNGAKQAELDWMDYDGTFTGKSITKSDIQDWINQNRIEIKEAQKGNRIKEINEEFEKKKDDWVYNVAYDAYKNGADRNKALFHAENIRNAVSSRDKDQLNETADDWNYLNKYNNPDEIDLNEIHDIEEDHMYQQDSFAEETKFSQYTLPGGKNYRELLLTMPIRVKDIDEVTELPSGYEYIKDGTKWGVIPVEQAHARPFSGLHDTKEAAMKSAIEKINRMSVQKAEDNAYKDTFKSSHFEESNILAHVRFNEREVNGERVLFLEEIQSDWAQKGKKEGFKRDNVIQAEKSYEEAKAKLDEINNELADVIKQAQDIGLPVGASSSEWRSFTLGNFKNEEVYRIEYKLESVRNSREWDEYQSMLNEIADKQRKIGEKRLSLIKEANEQEEIVEERKGNIDREKSWGELHGVPDMPFKKTDQWVNLAFRRMMRYAVENGFDRIAWTTGEQQANRYDLSNQIDEIEVSNAGKEEGYRIYFKKGDYVHNSKIVTESELPDFVGKDLAGKIVSDNIPEFKSKTYSGLDLKVGGEGMKAFYDNIVPKAAKKLGKPFGAEVEAIEIPKIGTQQSIPVTDLMKKTVLQGMPMFRKSEGKEKPTFKGDIAKFASEMAEWSKDISDSDYNDGLQRIIELAKAYDEAYSPQLKLWAAYDLIDEIDQIFSGGEFQTVALSSRSAMINSMRSHGLSEDQANKLEKSKAKVMGAYYASKVFINIAENKTGADIIGTWIHENAHDFNKNNWDKIVSLESKIDESVIDNYLPGSYKKDDKADKIDELISFVADEVMFGNDVYDFGDAQNDVIDLVEQYLNKITYGRISKSRIDRWRRGSANENTLADNKGSGAKSYRTDAVRTKTDQQAETLRPGASGSGGISSEGIRLKSISDVADSVDSKMSDLLRKEYDVKYNQFFTRFREAWEDTHLPVKNFLDLLRKNNVEVAEYNDFYKQATHLQGKNDAQLKIFKDTYQHPITLAINAIEQKGFSYRDIENYVFSKHGIERNEYMLKQEAKKDVDKMAINVRNKRMQSNSYLKAIESNDQDKINEAKKEVDKFVDDFIYGLSQKEANIWLARRKMDLNTMISNGTIDSDKYDELLDKANNKQKKLIKGMLSIREDELEGKDYAGITALEEELGETAQAYIDKFEDEAGNKIISDLWTAINKATKWTLTKQYQTGMMNKETYDELTSRYKYYVPLRGHDKETAEDRWDYTPDMGTYFTAPLLKARGRRSRAESPFAYIAQMAHSAITQGNKNTLKQAILRLAQKENGNLMSATRTWKVNVGTEENPIWERQSAPYSEDLETYLNNQRAFEERMQELKNEGMAFQGRTKLNIGDLFIKPKQAEQHEIQVFQNGISHTVYINANPAIARAINGANRKDIAQNLGFLANVTRNMAANFTTRNPLFIMTNLSRDYIFASTMILAKETPKYEAMFQGNLIKSLSALQRYERGKVDLNNQSDKYLYEYLVNGGKTGFSHIFELNRVAKSLEREAKKGGEKNWKDHSRAIIDVIDTFNEVAENMTRLSAYITSRQNGRSIATSVNDAKNITVNFNQKGAGSSVAKNSFERFILDMAGWVRPLYLFTNAAIQALSNVVKVTAKHPAKMASIVASYSLLGFISPLLAQLLGGDDGEEAYLKLTDWERQNNWCILLPNGSFLKIPLPHELRVFHRLGDNIYQLISGKQDVFQTLLDTMFSIADLLPMNPMGAAKTSWAELVPDAIRPFAQMVTNKNFMGSRIYNEWANENMPGYLKARTNKKGEYYAPNFMVDWFMYIDHITGGDSVKKGVISLNPDIANHLLRGYFGGLYTLAEQGVGIASETYNLTQTGEFNMKIRETPLKTFYADKNDLRIESSGLSSKYYEVSEKVNEARRRNKGYFEKVQEGDMSIEDYSRRVQDMNMENVNFLYDKIREIKRIEQDLKEMDPEQQKEAEQMIFNLKKEVVDMNNLH